MTRTKRQLQINVTMGSEGLNYSANALPPNERLVATFHYERAAKGPAWILDQIVTTGATIVEKNPHDQHGIVSLKRIGLLISEHE